MKENTTHILVLIDRSGSMTSIATDIIGGFNQFIKKQKEISGECFISLYQFDDIYEVVFERIKLQDVKDLDSNTYQPRNSTALYDAMGKTIDNYGKYLADLKEEERPGRVLFVTLSDGLNNASREHTLKSVQDRVRHQTEKYGWDFVFLGSNIDAWEASGSLGIARSSTLQFASCAGSVKNAYDALSKGAASYRLSTKKAAYAFTQKDQDDQDQFLDDKQKSKAKKTTK